MMPWVQIYDPLGNAVAQHAGRGAADRPAARHARRPRVARALGGARRARRRRSPSRSSSTACRSRTAAATAVYGAAYGLLPIGWIILNAVFLYNLTVATGQFEIVKASVGAPVGRSADPGAAHRVLVRRVHRRRGRLRHAGRDLLRRCSWASASRRSTPPACRSSPTPRRSRSAPSARRSSRSRAVTGIPAQTLERDGRTPAAVRVAHRAGLARRDDERLARAARRVAGRARLRRHRSRSCSSCGATSSAPSSSTSSGGLVSLGGAGAVLPCVEAGATCGTFPRRAGDRSPQRRVGRIGGRPRARPSCARGCRGCS